MLWGGGHSQGQRERAVACRLVTVDTSLPLLCRAPVSLVKDEQVPILPRVVSPASPGLRSDITLSSKEEFLSSLSPSWRSWGGGGGWACSCLRQYT